MTRALCRILPKPGYLIHLSIIALLLVAMTSPLLADAAPQTATDAPATAPAGDDFGQYLSDHQDELGPFFTRNAGDIFKLGLPVFLGMAGWVVLFTMLLGWGIDVLMSRGFTFLYAPAFAEWKRSVVYATGRLFLSFLYTCLMALAIIVTLSFAHAGVIISVSLLVLALVAFAAQIVWVLYLFRADFSVSTLFYLAVLIVHGIAAVIIAQPIMGARASAGITAFVDGAVTPRLHAEATDVRKELASAKADYEAVKAKSDEAKDKIAQAQAEQERIKGEIEEKKKSDIYIFAQIIKARAHGDLASARDQLAAFPGQFPGSSLDTLARTQLDQVNSQMAADQMQKRQADADAQRLMQANRADLLARAAKGQVTLSEMRLALIGKNRPQVTDLLGAPAETNTDRWGYRQQMILNPLTNEHLGLIVYFNQGAVQGVDYYRGSLQ